jgi:ATP-dependent Clp protease protease subunit
VDLYGYLMRNRIIFVNQRIGDDVACRVVASLLALDSLDDQEEIKLYINCAQARLTTCVLICNCYALALRVNLGPGTAASGGLVGGCCRGKNRLCVGTCGQQ